MKSHMLSELSLRLEHLSAFSASKSRFDHPRRRRDLVKAHLVLAQKRLSSESLLTDVAPVLRFALRLNHQGWHLTRGGTTSIGGYRSIGCCRPKTQMFVADRDVRLEGFHTEEERFMILNKPFYYGLGNQPSYSQV